MRLLDSRIRVRHKCPYCEFSGAFPELHVALWCNGDIDVMRIVAPDEVYLRRAIESAATFFGMDPISSDDRSSVLMTRDCGCPVSTESIESVAERFGCWPVQPSIYTGGWEHWRVFSRDQGSIRAFVEACARSSEVELLSHHARENLDVVDQVGLVGAQLFVGLTDRQIQVLATALDEGLLDVPARGSMDRAAKKVGISRSTYGEHLRKAVRQLVGNAYPLMRPAER